MNRRSFTTASLAAPAILTAASQASASAQAKKRKGNLKQSVCRWCYRDVPLEDLAKACAAMGLVGIDLLTPAEWPVVQKYGLKPTMASGVSNIANGINRTEHHGEISRQLREMFSKAKAAGVENIIIFSGNRRGMSDEQGMDNCVRFLEEHKAEAEDKGLVIQMELLNSKVNHPDYMCDLSKWGVQMCQRVNSPSVKLLYDIYHMQIMEGDVIRTVKDNLKWFGHFHTGGVPGRNEIDNTQELYYPAIVKAILDGGYKGYFAHEFIPKRTPLQSLEEATTLCDV